VFAQDLYNEEMNIYMCKFRLSESNMISKENMMKFWKRRKIYNFIAKNPGLNIREISRRLNIPITTLKHHLRYFKKLNIIKEKTDGKYLRIFVSNEVGKNDEQLLCLFRSKTSCRILLYLLFSLSFSQIELSKELELSPPLTSYHLKKMAKMGIIEEIPVKNNLIYLSSDPEKDFFIERKPIKSEKFYRRKNQEIIDAATRILITHKQSLPDEEFINSYLDYSENYKDDILEKKIKTIDEGINSAIDFLLDIFRPPFCY